MYLLFAGRTKAGRFSYPLFPCSVIVLVKCEGGSRLSPCANRADCPSACVSGFIYFSPDVCIGCE